MANLCVIINTIIISKSVFTDFYLILLYTFVHIFSCGEIFLTIGMRNKMVILHRYTAGIFVPIYISCMKSNIEIEAIQKKKK